MTMRKLLVALDHSPRAAGVLDAAVALAARADAKLVLVRATSIGGELPVEAYVSDPRAVTEVLAHRAQEDLALLARSVPQDRVAAVRVEEGPAPDVIERVAREENADMIVIGAHAYGPMERLLGTVAAKVVNHADRSVMVVRDPERIR
jgi:nucleotide-binding universal stress UspA family protein